MSAGWTSQSCGEYPEKTRTSGTVEQALPGADDLARQHPYRSSLHNTVSITGVLRPAPLVAVAGTSTR